MYNEYFKLNESPFSVAPDPRYLYMSEQHREALAHLMYGFNSNGGFVLLTGEVGTGKTTVCRCMLEQLPEKSSIAFILNPKLTAKEMLATICDEFGIKYTKRTKSIKVFVDMINRYLIHSHSRGRKAVLIIDEAQNLSADVLEQLRLLTNLETNQHKLLQIILLGQPELKDKLARPELRQLSQRIIARYHLGPLSGDDVNAYVKYRLSVAGLQKQLFPAPAIMKLTRLSGGVPRLINIIADRALLGTYTRGESTVSKSILKEAALEILGPDNNPTTYKRTYAWVLTVLLFVVVSAVLAASYKKNGSEQTIAGIKPEPAALNKTLETKHIEIGSLKWPSAKPMSESSNMAYRALFQKWGRDYVTEERSTACDYARTQGLRCENKQGNLRSLTLLDRPAILKLFDEQGQEYYITLTAINGETATIMIGDETRTVYISEIESRWLGDYTFLWQIPPYYQRDIKPGAQDPLVPWMEKQFAVINNRPEQQRKTPVFDESLVNEVKDFQLVKGLVPDGIVGSRTLIHINTSVSGSIPKLTAREAE